MRQQSPLLWALLAASALGGPAAAQTAPALEPVAAPAAPMPPYQPLPPLGISAIVGERIDWKTANETVGQFRRGHMDILKWERAQTGSTAPATSTPGQAEVPR